MQATPSGRLRRKAAVWIFTWLESKEVRESYPAHQPKDLSGALPMVANASKAFVLSKEQLEGEPNRNSDDQKQVEAMLTFVAACQKMVMGSGPGRDGDRRE